MEMRNGDLIVVADHDDVFYGYYGTVVKVRKFLIEVKLDGVRDTQKFLSSEIKLRESFVRNY